MNKYNEYMSHIEVTDEMKARVLANVSKAIAEQKAEGGSATEVTPMPVVRKKKPVPIAAIISIAASLLIVGGIAIAFLSNAMSSSSSKSKSSKPDTAAQTATRMPVRIPTADLTKAKNGKKRLLLLRKMRQLL